MNRDPDAYSAKELGERCMPTRGQLLAAGRGDLVRAVGRAGGFLEVALVSTFTFINFNNAKSYDRKTATCTWKRGERRE
jgi:hypothetical protein